MIHHSILPVIRRTALVGVLVFGTSALALADPLSVRGVNVDMGVLLPGAPNYLMTSAGDLWDISRKAGFTTFRVTIWETWGGGQTAASYVGRDWTQIRRRAEQTHIDIIPVFGLDRAGRKAVADAGSDDQKTSVFTSLVEERADAVLDGGGFAHSPALNVVDLENEPKLEQWKLDAFDRISRYIRHKYPGVRITIGGWGGPSDDGAKLLPYEDVVSPHIYGVGGHRFDQEGPQQASNGMLLRLQGIARWAGSKPILVEEFGARVGTAPKGDENGAEIPSDAQRGRIQAEARGIVRAAASGINVEGGVYWMLAPRGAPEFVHAHGNETALLYPQGSGQPLNVLPGLQALCEGYGTSNCGGAAELVASPPVQRHP